MMTLIRITSADDSRLNRLIPLYEESFPESERRKIGQLKRMIENHAPMYFNAIECDGELSGMFVYWDMGDFYYLEPSYHALEDACPLWIMGSEDSPRLAEQVERIKEEVYRQQVG